MRAKKAGYTEVEAKFLAQDRAVIGEIAACRRLLDYDVVPRGQAFQSDVYFDTPGSVLHRAGASLRLRRKAGSLVVTYKRPLPRRRGSRAVFERREVESLVPPMRTPGELTSGLRVHLLPLREAAKSVELNELLPVLTVRNRRRSFELVYSPVVLTGGPRKRRPGWARTMLPVEPGTADFEMCLDDGSFVGRGRSIPFIEVELEALTGDRLSLRKLCGYFVNRYRLKPSSGSKYERAMKLLYGH